MPQIIQPQIFWDPGLKKYAVKTAPSQQFASDMATFFGARFDGINKIWLVDEDEDINLLKEVVTQHWPERIYGKLDFVEKPDPNRKQNLPQTNGNAAAVYDMFGTVGYAEARQIYSRLIAKYHPDKQNQLPENERDPKAHDKAVAITKGWQEIKSHFGW